MDSVSIGIVTYNNQDKICDLLDSIYKYTNNVCFKVYIVDNASSDRTIELVKKYYPDVIVLPMNKNLGFGAGHNKVLPLLNSDYHMIVNPDIRLHSNAIGDLSKYLDDNQDVVLVTPKILNEDGTEQHLPKKRPQIRYLFAGRLTRYNKYFFNLRKQYTLENKLIDKQIEVDFATGCFSMIRTDIFKKINGFDDRFFMYLEDADLTLRAKQYGRIIFNPEISVVHGWERSSSKNIKFLLIHINSMRKFMWKWRKYK